MGWDIAGNPTERARDRPVREQPLARSEHDRKDDEPDGVDQAGVEQRLGECAAAVHLQLPAGLLLELGDFGHDVSRVSECVDGDIGGRISVHVVSHSSECVAGDSGGRR